MGTVDQNTESRIDDRWSQQVKNLPRQRKTLNAKQLHQKPMLSSPPPTWLLLLLREMKSPTVAADDASALWSSQGRGRCEKQRKTRASRQVDGPGGCEVEESESTDEFRLSPLVAGSNAPERLWVMAMKTALSMTSRRARHLGRGDLRRHRHLTLRICNEAESDGRFRTRVAAIVVS